MKKLTLTMPAETHRKLKILAANENRTMASIIIEDIESRWRAGIDLPKPAQEKKPKQAQAR